MSTIPKIQEIQALIKTAIEASTWVRATYEDQNDNDDETGIFVISDDGKKSKAIERQLRTKGAVIVVEPILKLDLRDQSGTEFIMDATVMVKVMVNPERNSDTVEGGLGIDIMEACVAVGQALTRKTRHQGGEFLRFAEDAVALSQFDPGLWVYDLTFTKEVML